jgi:hypothetical protein
MLERIKEKETQWQENQQVGKQRSHRLQDSGALERRHRVAVLTKEKATTGKKLMPAR